MTNRCSYLIRGATIVDGSGSSAFTGDVAIAGDRIIAVCDCDGFEPEEVIDAEGLTLCPGFIDVHAHDDRLLLEQPEMHPKITQGVTTVIVGNCGLSLAPLTRDTVPEPLHQLTGGKRFADFPGYFAAIDRAGPATNVAVLVGHTTLRVEAMSDISRRADADEAERMRALCRDAIEAGVIGLSSGLYYPPAQGADWQEVADLVVLVGAAGGVYPAHIRDEADHIVEAMEEALQIAETGGAPLVISHHKLMGEANFGRASETLALIDDAAQKQAVGFDVYPYTAGASMILPSLAALAARTIISSSEPYPHFAGRDLSDITAELRLSKEEAAKALAPGTAIYFMMDENDVKKILAHPKAMVGSDGIADANPHPRLWGTFPRVLGHYARDHGLLPLTEAVHRMTGKPAAFFGLEGRGTITEGAYADLVLIDAATIIDLATFEEPETPSEGIVHVMVNGRFALRDRVMTAERSGKVLKRSRISPSQKAECK
ncbi:MAG: N-acyl-D-amino-acid deacylase family protein [Sphingorhabdus sp.]